MEYTVTSRVADKVRIYIPIMPISSPNSMFDNFCRDDSNKWLNIGFDEEITQEQHKIEVNFTHLV